VLNALPFRVGSSQPDEARALAVSAAGNVVVASWFAGTVDFDPRSGATFRSAFGAQDVAVASYTSDGELQWVTQYGGTGGDVPVAVIATPDGGSVVTGYSAGGAVCGGFGPPSNGGRDIMLIKLGPSGACEWSQLIGGNQDDEGRALIYDGNGGVVIAGLFRGTVDFDPGSGATVLVSRGGSDGFVARYDLQDGSLRHLAQSGGLEDDAFHGVSISGNGDILAAGEFRGQATFGSPLAPVILTSTGGADLAIANWTSLLGLRWATRAGGPLNDRASALAVDVDGSVIVAGNFEGTADFDPSPGTALLVSKGSSDAFVARYDGTTGVYANLSRAFGGSGNEGVTSVMSTLGRMIVTGWFQATVDFDPGAGVSLSTARGTSGAGDGFVLALDTPGSFQWVAQIGAVIAGDANLAIAYGAAEGLDGAIWTVGRFGGRVDLDLGSGVVELQSVGATDQFVAAFEPGTGAVRVTPLP
jgi:hypothetical protein